MVLNALVAATHYLALALGFAGVTMRAQSLRAFGVSNLGSIRRILAADNMWGIAAFLWLASGIWRAFGGLEKGSAYYLHNHVFYLKMALFVLVFLLEIKPMTTFLRWRVELAKEGRLKNPGDVQALARTSAIQAAVLVLIVLCASLMARGIGSA